MCTERMCVCVCVYNDIYMIYLIYVQFYICGAPFDIVDILFVYIYFAAYENCICVYTTKETLLKYLVSHTHTQLGIVYKYIFVVFVSSWSRIVSN